MKHVVFTERVVRGGERLADELPEPTNTFGFYRDLAVLAFPRPDGEAVAPADQHHQHRPVDALFAADGSHALRPGVPVQIDVQIEVLIIAVQGLLRTQVCVERSCCS